MKNIKGFYVALATCICMIFVLSYTIGGIKKADGKLAELNEEKKDLEFANNNMSSNYKVADNKEYEEKSEEDVKENDIVTEKTEETDILASFDAGIADYEEYAYNVTDEDVFEDYEDTDEEVVETSGNVYDSEKQLHFDTEAKLAWPVEGEILKDFSLDKMIYFETLGQFKTNNCIMIKADKGENVNASYRGIVKSVGKSYEDGNIVEIDIGDNYVVSYAQIDGICVNEGDMVEEGDVIGVIAEPTGYYTDEGSHLSFKVTKDSLPVNPKELLR
ncbi:MAG: M23 family metallopeptidase [Lachnospiraceae bacterium]|nr:M23 family metallopeptidase [Lachnospiraceae bacterium]